MYHHTSHVAIQNAGHGNTHDITPVLCWTMCLFLLLRCDSSPASSLLNMLPSALTTALLCVNSAFGQELPRMFPCDHLRLINVHFVTQMFKTLSKPKSQTCLVHLIPNCFLRKNYQTRSALLLFLQPRSFCHQKPKDSSRKNFLAILLS